MEKVLFIDDEKEIIDALKDYFDSKYDVYTALTYDQAIELIKQHSFDCIVSDVNLVDKEGFDIVKFVKGRNSKTPVLLLSGLTQEEMILKGFSVGADDYIRKPFSLAELNARISTRLKKSGNRVHTYGDLVVDEDAGIVTFKGQELRIANMEFNILVFLINHEGQTFDKQAIYNEIWQQAPLDQMHTVQVHMFTLRKKILEATGMEYIKTIWKKGYMFSYNKESDKGGE